MTTSPAQHRYAWAVIAAFLVWSAAGTVWITPWAALLFVPFTAVADDAINARLDRWVVYQLVDSRGLALYVGSTNDLPRRALEHTDGSEPDPWRALIAGYNEARWCRSERQARRIEQRRITVINHAAAHHWCPPLHNEIWSTAHRTPAARAVAALWFPFYLVMSWLVAGCCFHTFAASAWDITRRPDPDLDDLDEWDSADNAPPDGPPLTATYERYTPPGPSVTPRSHALPPARYTEPARKGPFRVPPTGPGEPPAGNARRHRRNVADAVDRIDTLMDDTRPDRTGTPNGDDGGETADERRRRLTRERVARHRRRRQGRQ